jgi:hypothetical protein
MNIEQLKTEWQHYNEKLSVSQRLNEKIIQTMIKERSRSRVSKIRRQTIMYMILMVFNLVLFVAIFAGNPFDFKYTVQYVPFGILTIGVLMAMYSLFKTLQRFNVNMNHVSLEHFLTSTIGEFEKNKKMETWFGSIIFAAGTLTVFSFLPKKLENKGLWPALAETALSIAITLVMYFVAYKLGAFKNRKKEGFENDLKELEELKAISSDLKEN